MASQKHEGWVLLPDSYDDGGLSGGPLERPALRELLAHVRGGRVDQIVVYKIDRLTRSLADFSKIVDILDAAEASFVSVTQSFNTATSMGRLTLNMLLRFSQFEREVTAERIRDKIAASKRKGLWMGGQVPMGYDADGRTLQINEAEARTIRTLYDLYERHGTVRAVREHAMDLGLRTRLRETGDGKVSDRGHIHHILTNPIYAGRIRHKDRTFAGQHPALIDPERWDTLQLKLKDRASKARGKKRAGRQSLLCGKLFDETGDRLTPSHTKTARGTRLRYYISHRLIARSGEANLDGWRLPAPELEAKVADLVRVMLSDRGFAGRLAYDATADEVGRIATALAELAASKKSDAVLSLIETITLTSGELRIRLDAERIGEALGLDPDTFDGKNLEHAVPFQLRKRGVETRLVLADSPTEPDQRLIANIAKAHHRFNQIKAGHTFTEIATEEATSKRRIQQMIDLAFLAPDIIRDVLQGKQPLGFTSDWCLRHSLPANWTEQRRILASL